MSDPGMLQVVLMGLITVFVGLICLIIIIVILGIFDDIYALSAKLKFCVQIFSLADRA